MRKKPNDIVKDWRECAGLSQYAVENKIGDYSGQYRQWESGNRSTLPLRFRVEIAHFSDISLLDICNERERRMLLVVRDLLSKGTGNGKPAKRPGKRS